MSKNWLNLLLIPSLSLAGQYDDAINSAEQAAYIQTGLADLSNKLQKYGVQQAKQSGLSLGLSEQQLKVISGIGAEAWFIYKHKAVSIPTSSSATIIVNMDSITWSHSF